MKKVMFICNNLGGGGAERVITILANKFAKMGYKSEFCTFIKYDRSYPVSSNISIKTLFSRGENISQIKKLWTLRKAIKESNPDVIISFEYFVNIKVILVNLGLKNKVIISERNNPETVGGKFPMNIIRNIAYSFCDKLVCQTPDAMAYFPKNIQKKSVIIPNPIKSDLPEMWKGQRNKEIVNFCRLEKQKNLPLLIDSFKEIYEMYPEYTLHIFGDGKEKENLEKYILDKKMQSCAFIHKAIPNIHERVLKSTMFVSSSDYEGLSNSMLEAMALGIPTICTDCPCGGARMVINNGQNGLLVPVGDKQKLVEAMKSVIESNEVSQNLSKNSKKIKEDLSAETIIKNWLEAIEV